VLACEQAKCPDTFSCQLHVLDALQSGHLPSLSTKVRSMTHSTARLNPQRLQMQQRAR